MLDVFLDALLDTALIIPVLLAVHLLIELLEVKAFGRLQNNKVLKGRFAPLIGAGVGLLPQCGFSVVAGDMYSKKYIRIGTLAAVFIATSDEAIPILFGEALTSPDVWLMLLQLILIKVVMAVAAGYFLNFVFRKRDLAAAETAAAAAGAYGCCGHAVVGAPKECELNAGVAAHAGGHSHGHSHGHTGHGGEESGEAEHHGESRAKHIWHTYLKHPLIHTSVIAGIVFIINMLMGSVIYLIGEETLAEFMTQMLWLQPLLSALVGLIPNCASSVIIAEMFISGSLTLGAAVSGLAINAGMGFAILFKENKNFKENIGLLVGLFLFSVAAGYIITVCEVIL